MGVLRPSCPDCGHVIVLVEGKWLHYLSRFDDEKRASRPFDKVSFCDCKCNKVIELMFMRDKFYLEKRFVLKVIPLTEVSKTRN